MSDTVYAPLFGKMLSNEKRKCVCLFIAESLTFEIRFENTWMVGIVMSLTISRALSLAVLWALCLVVSQTFASGDKKTYACNRWQLAMIPWIHGILALLSSNRNPIDYIHNKYKNNNFIKAYAPVIYGINVPMVWPKTNDKPLECPLFKKHRDRPKKARKLQTDEVRVGRKNKA
ncbi:hypothetical protein QYF36_010966 [Acer negundo]|nr:hypothetical protein QYF36_010966 [Acer negundo]